MYPRRQVYLGQLLNNQFPLLFKEKRYNAYMQKKAAYQKNVGTKREGKREKKTPQ